MNVFNKITLQSLRQNRSRTLGTIIGLILSVSMITAITTLISSLQNYLIKDAILGNGDWHVMFKNINSEIFNKVSTNTEVEHISLVQDIGYSPIDKDQNTTDFINIVGLDNHCFDTFSNISSVPKLLSGKRAQNNGEIVIPKHLRNNNGTEYAIGDILKLEIGDDSLFDDGSTKFNSQTTITYKVVGICDRPYRNVTPNAYTMITNADIQNDTTIGSFNMYIKLKSPKKVYDFIKNNAKDVESSTNKYYLRWLGISQSDGYNRLLYSLGGILIALIMFGSVLMIYNSFAISVSERTKQFGILSSVGATKKQLRKAILYEGVYIGMIGIPIGIFSGIAGISITLKFIYEIFKMAYLTLSISTMAIIIAIIIGIIIVLLSAYIPARKATKLSAIESIRQTDDIKIKPKKIKTSKFIKRFLGLEGMLASKNFKRNKKRYRTTIFSLFISIVLFVSASSLGMYLKVGVESSLEYKYDIGFCAEYMKEEDILKLYNKLKDINYVTDSSYTLKWQTMCKIPKNILNKEWMQYATQSDDSDDFVNLSIVINFLDDNTYINYLKNLGLSENEYDQKDAKLIALSKLKSYNNEFRRFVSSNVFKEKNAISLQLLKYPEEYGPVTFKVVDELPNMMTEGTMVITAFAPYSIYKQFNSNMQVFSDIYLMFTSKNIEKSLEHIETVIREFGVDPDEYELFNILETNKQDKSMTLIVNIFIYGFIILISLIAITNIFNTISTNINLRRREFAMLKSVGMTNSSFRKMMNLECIFYGCKALLFGLPTAIFSNFLIYRSMNFSSLNIAFKFPWHSIFISIFSVFFVVFVTMIYSMRKIKKENILDALKSENF